MPIEIFKRFLANRTPEERERMRDARLLRAEFWRVDALGIIVAACPLCAHLVGTPEADAFAARDSVHKELGYDDYWHFIFAYDAGRITEQEVRACLTN